jgi:hypothetical protein
MMAATEVEYIGDIGHGMRLYMSNEGQIINMA